MSASDEVREASRRFYTALTSMLTGDSAQMADAWSHDDDVTAMHPIGGCEVGWDAVLGSFQGVAQIASAGSVHLHDQRIRVSGDMAFETGVEHGRATLAGHDLEFRIRVTNVYARDAGSWKMIHHHTDISPDMLDLLAGMESA